MLQRCISVRRVNYIHFRLWRETHSSMVEMKRSLDLKSNNMLASCLLNTTVRLSQIGEIPHN